MLYRFLHPIVNRLARLLAVVEVVGVENMPRRGGILLISNHLTSLDPLLLGMCFVRALHFMAKAELFQNPALARLFTTLCGFPVRRGEIDRVAIRHAESLLQAGKVVAIFPEGHRSRSGRVQEAHGGVALLARRTGVPILPIAIMGTEHMVPAELLKWRPWRRPHVRIVVGEPFIVQRADRSDSAAQAEQVMSRVLAMLPPPMVARLGRMYRSCEATERAFPLF